MHLLEEIKRHSLAIWSRIVGQPLIATAAILLLIAVALALADRVAAGSLVAALFVVLALFHFLPEMESFKAFGIQAKWRARLREADEILGKLRQWALASGQLAYHMLGWGSRMGGKHSKMRQALADQIDGVLTDLDVDRDELTALKRDYLFFASYDLFQIFEMIVQMNIRTNQQRALQVVSQLSGENPGAPELREAQERANNLQSKPSPDLLEELPKVDFREFCHGRIPKADLPKQDVLILEQFADHVADVLNACRRTARVTDEAAELIDSYSSEDRLKLYRELFNQEPIE